MHLFFYFLQHRQMKMDELVEDIKHLDINKEFVDDTLPLSTGCSNSININVQYLLSMSLLM
jgi:hypothetical protein